MRVRSRPKYCHRKRLRTAASPMTEWACTLRSNEHVDTTPRLIGDHCTSYLFCCDVAAPTTLEAEVCPARSAEVSAPTSSFGMSAIGYNVWRSHRMVRLSLPQLCTWHVSSDKKVDKRRVDMTCVLTIGAGCHRGGTRRVPGCLGCVQRGWRVARRCSRGGPID